MLTAVLPVSTLRFLGKQHGGLIVGSNPSLRGSLVAFSFLLAACGGGGGGGGGSEAPREIASVRLDPGESTLAAIGADLQITATALDAAGNEIAGVSFEWASTEPDVVSVDFDGLARAKEPGTSKVTATAPNGIFGRSTILVAPVVSRMVYQTGPVDIAAGDGLPEIRISLRDSNGHVVRNAENMVTLGLVGEASATLIGTTERLALGGEVTFAGLRMTRAGTYRLEAVADGLPPVQSDEFRVSHLAADRLAFASSPEKVELFDFFQTQVEVRDRHGNRVSDWNGPVTIVLEESVDPDALFGTPIAEAAEGLAQFTLLIKSHARSLMFRAEAQGLEPVKSAPFDVRLTLAEVTAGDSYSCGVSVAGRVHCWGENRFGTLATGDVENRHAPTPIVGDWRYRTVSAGGSRACALDRNGKAWCWGDNLEGKLGIGGVGGQQEEPVAVSGGHSFTQIHAGYRFSCALTSTGQAWCWGSNALGMLGNGNSVDSPVPVAVTGGHAFVAITAGNVHACGLTGEGKAYCWGGNAEGQLGDGTTEDSWIPVAVAGDRRFRQIGAGHSNTCALDVDGAAFCWGSARALGNGTSEDAVTPTKVSGDRTFASIHVGPRSTCALDATGAAYCWGDGAWGVLGTGDEDPRPVPTPVAGGLAFRTIGLGDRHGCGITTSDETWCWGDGTYGALGTGSNEDASTPVLVPMTIR